MVTVPFSGHFKIISKLAKQLLLDNNALQITLIITGWENIKLNQQDVQELLDSGVKLIEISKDNLQSSQPMQFTFPRVVRLTDQVIEACRGSDYIFYDFFSIEGYIAAKTLQVQAVCSIPAIMGPFNSDCQLLKYGIANNIHYIQSLENKYNIEITNKLEMISDGFLLPSDFQNIQWSWKKFITAKNYTANRSTKEYLFARPEKASTQAQHPLINILQALKPHKKIIYLSLGTVVTGNLWNNVPSARQFIKGIFQSITNRFANDSAYEIVVATGRPAADLFDFIPDNFHVYEHVVQQDILAVADVFVTHGGGNSVNESIDAGTPMVVIPFFGDQHLCADNIEKLSIGISLAADIQNIDAAINTTASCLERASMRNNALTTAILRVLDDKNIKSTIKKLKSSEHLNINKLIQTLKNNQLLDWHEGDLLYGCNADRKKLASLTGREKFFRIGNMQPFTTLFSDLVNTSSLPKIIDQYHDVLTDTTITSREMSSSKFQQYKKTLEEYQHEIAPHLDKLKGLKHNQVLYNEVIWDMCVVGLKFFLHKQQNTIHFVLEKFNDKINLATRREISWIRKNWHNDAVRRNVKFYIIKDGALIKADPEKWNWFNQRPTPSLKDSCPELIDRNQWCAAMHDVRARKQHSFFNTLPERYPNELADFKSSGLTIIDIQKSPELAKKSLATGLTHIYSQDENGTTTILQKNSGNLSLKHPIVARNNPATCLGEIRLRSISVNNKYLKVIDISNDSGHYMPDASGFNKAIQAFAQLGYIVHRINVVNPKVPESLNRVEQSFSEFPEISKTMTIL